MNQLNPVNAISILHHHFKYYGLPYHIQSFPQLLSQRGLAALYLHDLLTAFIKAKHVQTVNDELRSTMNSPSILLRLQGSMKVLENVIGMSLEHIHVEKIISGDEKHILMAIAVINAVLSVVEKEDKEKENKEKKLKERFEEQIRNEDRSNKLFNSNLNQVKKEESAPPSVSTHVNESIQSKRPSTAPSQYDTADPFVQPSPFKPRQVNADDDKGILEAIDYLERFILQAKQAQDRISKRPQTAQPSSSSSFQSTAPTESTSSSMSFDKQNHHDHHYRSNQAIHDRSDDEDEMERIHQDKKERTSSIKQNRPKRNQEHTHTHSAHSAKDKRRIRPPSTRLYPVPPLTVPPTARLHSLAESLQAETALISLIPVSSSLSLQTAQQRRRHKHLYQNLTKVARSEEKERLRKNNKLLSSFQLDEYKRNAHIQKVEQDAIRRSLKTMERVEPKAEKELEKEIREQASRIERLIKMKRDSLKKYYQDQAAIVVEEEKEKLKRETRDKKDILKEIRRLNKELNEKKEKEIQRLINLADQSDERYSLSLEDKSNIREGRSGRDSFLYHSAPSNYVGN